MGVSLEVGKLVTAVWLHRHWDRAVWWLKTYLAIAVVILMFITSMGIFGYLSKAHIEQTSMSIEQVAQIDSLEEKMIRSTAKVDRWTAEIDRLLKGDNVRVDTLIEKEQEALTKVYAHINKEKKLANDQANSDIKLLTNDKTDAQEQADRFLKWQITSVTFQRLITLIVFLMQKLVSIIVPRIYSHEQRFVMISSKTYLTLPSIAS